MSVYAEVALGLPLTQTFTYAIPEAIRAQAKVGSRVLVPFQRRKITGFIVGLKLKKKTEEFEVKDIHEVLDEEPVFTDAFLSFTQKLSDSHFSSWGEMLEAALPPSYVPKSRIKMSLSGAGKSALQNDFLSAGETEILELLEKGDYAPSFIVRKIKQKNLSSILARLKRKGLILTHSDLETTRRRAEKEGDLIPVQLEMDFSLDEESCRASDLISGHLGKNIFS